MEQLIEAFGIDVKLITVQIINFILLMVVLSYFLYKPVLKVLADRKEAVKQGIADAEAAARAKKDADAEKQKVVTAAHEEAAAIAARATETASEKSARIAEEAQEKKNAVLAEAEREAEEIKKRAEKESEAEIAKMAILAAEKILKGKTS